VSDVELEDRVPPRACADRRCTEAFNPPPLDDARSIGDRRAEDVRHRPVSTAPRSARHTRPGPWGHSGRIVIGARETGESIQEDERGDPLGMRRGDHRRHLRRVALCNERRLLRPRGVHHSDEVVHPRLDWSIADDRGRHPDSPHVEPEDAGKPGETLDELLEERLLRDRLDVAPPVVDEDDVRRAVAVDRYAMSASPLRAYCVRVVTRNARPGPLLAASSYPPRGSRGAPARARSPRRAP
jgi:hypothetical protein